MMTMLRLFMTALKKVSTFAPAHESTCTKQTQSAQPYEYNRIMGIGSVSSSIGSLPAIQDPATLLQLRFRLVGVQKVDRIMQLEALTLRAGQEDVDEAKKP